MSIYVRFQKVKAAINEGDEFHYKSEISVSISQYPEKEEFLNEMER